MSNEPPRPEAAEATEQARAKAERLCAAFAAVFGQPRGRTDSQKRVLAHLASCAGAEQNAFQFQHTGRDGVTIALAAAQIDGANSILKVINRQLSLAAKSKLVKPDKPQTKR